MTHVIFVLGYRVVRNLMLDLEGTKSIAKFWLWAMAVIMNHFDLVGIGFMGHSKVYDRVWGSTSQNIARLVP